MSRMPMNNQRIPPPMTGQQQPHPNWRGGTGRGSGPPAPFFRGVTGVAAHGGRMLSHGPPTMQPGMPPMMMQNGRGGNVPQHHQPSTAPTGFRGGNLAQPPRFAGGGRVGLSNGRMNGSGRSLDGGRGPFIGSHGGGGRGGRTNGGGVGLSHPPFSGPGRPPFNRGGGRMNFRGGAPPPLNHRFHGNGPGRIGPGLPPPPPPPGSLNNNNNQMFPGGHGSTQGYNPRLPQQPLTQSHLTRPPFVQPPGGVHGIPGTFPSQYPGVAAPSAAANGGAAAQQQINTFAGHTNLPHHLSRPNAPHPPGIMPMTSAYHQRIPPDSAPNIVTSTTAGAAPVERPWAEYTDASTGKTYYSNGVTSQWTKPEAMVQAEQAAEKRQQEGEDAAESGPRKKRKGSSDGKVQIPEFATKEEALEAFKKLLSDRDVTPAQKWGEVAKLFGGNGESVIWEGCEKALTTGERKQALAEYQTKLANDLRVKERQERQRSKEAYLKLLSEILPTVSGKQGTKSNYLSFQDVQGLLQKDDRYHAIDDDSTREALFVEFWEEYRKREERRKQIEKREEQNAFIDVLKDLVEAGILTCATHNSWSSFVASLDISVREKYSRFMESSSPSDTSASGTKYLDIQEKDFLFARYLDDLQREEEENRLRSQEDRRQAELGKREFYIDTLVTLAKEGKILPSSSFNSIVSSVLSKENSFIQLHLHDRDRPRELFEDFVNNWNESYRGDRLFLSDIVRRTYETFGRNIVSDSDGSYDAFCKLILGEAQRSSNAVHDKVLSIISNDSPVSSAQLYFREMQQPRKNIPSQAQRGTDEGSSEDEGEIAEDEETTTEKPASATV